MDLSLHRSHFQVLDFASCLFLAGPRYQTLEVQAGLSWIGAVITLGGTLSSQLFGLPVA